MAAAGDKLFVNAIVLCELVWVLRSAYGHTRKAVCAVLEALLESPEFVIEDADLARKALKEYASGTGDFADALIAHRNQRSGCELTWTFDKNLKQHRLFSML